MLMGTPSCTVTLASHSPRVLVVDDEAWIRGYIRELLVEWGFSPRAAADVHAAQTILSENDVDLVVADLFIRDESGLSIIASAQRLRCSPEVIIMTGQGSNSYAVEALSLGAFDYLAKPLDAERLRLTICRALEMRRLKAEVARLSGNGSHVFAANVAASTLALHDSVTGLPNRGLFFDRLHQALLNPTDGRQSVSLIVLSVDGLRRVGIAYGPAHYDAVLADVARGLAETAFRRDTVSRTGDNEFAIIADVKTPERVIKLLGKISTLASTLRAEKRPLERISFSMGVALYPADGASPEELYQRALMALDTQQSRGGAGYQFYHAERDREIQRFVELERRLADGLRDGRFSIVLQPYHRLADASVHGAEALLRWDGGDGIAASPSEFIPVLESNRTIVDVTEWIVGELALLQARFLDEGMTDQWLSLNVSPAHLARYDDACRLVALIAERFRDPSRVIVEVTEGIFLEDSATTDRVMAAFTEAGIQLAIDDFGTGYASLSYLTRYGFGYIKIDRSFVGSADINPDTSTIVAAIVSMAQQLGIATVAEGVENGNQLDLLRRLGCDVVQGYHFSRPLDPDSLLEYARRSRQEATA